MGNHIAMLLQISTSFLHCIRNWPTAFAVAAIFHGYSPAFAGPTDTAPRLEYQVKAGYLFNFLRFTDWPPQALPDGAPYRIGVVADPAAFAVIADALRGKTLSKREIEIQSLRAGESIEGYHLIFVSRAAEALNPGNLRSSAGVLLVGETEGFAMHGGMIGFVVRDHNIRFQVNLPAAQQSGLKLSGRLASLAELVQTKVP